MTNDAKEWVTVKVEKPVRDAARDDPRTYTDIMRAGLDAPNPENDADINRDLLAERVVEQLEGSKRLSDMAFEDWFEPDYAETIAAHINAEIATGNVTLEASERRRIAQEVAEALR